MSFILKRIRKEVPESRVVIIIVNAWMQIKEKSSPEQKSELSDGCVW
jgi:hypothetical protein